MSHSWCCYLLLLSIQAIVRLFLISTVDCFDDDGDLVLLPVDPEVEDGQWLTLNCTILPQYTGNYTNRDLYFRHGNDIFRNTTLAGNRTALLRLQWTLTEDGQGGGHVRCVLPDRRYVWTAIQSITVVRRPLQPTVTGCLLLNWQHVNCTWQPSSVEQQAHIHTHTELNQTLQWKLGDEFSDVWWDVICKDLGTDCCAWNISHIVERLLQSSSCCVRVFARLRLKHLHFEERSEQFCFRPSRNLVLSSPRNVTTVITEARQVAVHWQAPLLDLNHIDSANIVYAVTVMSQWTDMPVVNRSVVNRFISFASLPHTRYAVIVKVKTAESQMWSKPTSHSFMTAPAVPNMSPASSPNAFSISHVGKYARSVIVYWKMLQQQDYCGRWLNYIVLLRKPPVLDWRVLRIVKSANESCVEVNVDTDADVEITVVAKNEVGETSPDVVMHLPAVKSSGMTTSLFDELVVELTNDSTVLWSWQLKSPESAGNLTLFWCRSQSSLSFCAGDIHWLDVAASQAQYNLTIDASDTKHYYYGAALKADDTRNSGIEWAACLYNVSGLAAPVRDLKAFLPPFGHSGQLLVTWTLPSCNSGNQLGHIKSFVLYYCRYAGTECSDEPSHILLEGYRTTYNLTGLEPGEEYGVWIYSRTRLTQTHSEIVTAATSSLIKPALIAGLVVGSIIVLFFVVVVVWMLSKYCRRCHAKLWSPVAISVPSTNVQSSTYVTNATSAPIIEYSRISYTRQGSRLSSSSRDSGQFGIASGSPLMSPESCSGSGVVTFTMPDNHVAKPGFDGIRTPVTTYVNDTVVALRCPGENSHHKPSPAASGHAECFPLQPLKSRQPHDAVSNRDILAAAAGGENDEDETHVYDSLMKNGSHDPPVPRQNTDYVPHKWLNM